MELKMRFSISQTVALVSMFILALGAAAGPATRPSTVGQIAASASDVTPLGKGAHLPRLIVKSADGQTFDLNAAVEKEPTVLLFYRGGWCPNCLRLLSGMEGVSSELTNLGYQLLAVSPDKPEELIKTVDKEQLTYALLSDSSAAAIRAFGLAYQGAAAQFNMLEKYSGETHHALPLPAVYIIGTDGTINVADCDAESQLATRPWEIVKEAKALVAR